MEREKAGSQRKLGREQVLNNWLIVVTRSCH